MRVHEILAEASSPKGTVFEIFLRMLPKEVTKATLKEVDDAIRWLARTAKTSPDLVDDIAVSLVAGSKQMGISIREMAQIAEPKLIRAGIDPADINQALNLAEKLAEPSMWQKFKTALGLGGKKEPKTTPPTAPTTTPTTPTTANPTAPTTTPTTPTTANPTAPTTTPTTPTTANPTAPTAPSRISAAEADSWTRRFMEKYNPKYWSWWERADAIAMAYGIIEPWYTFRKDSNQAIAEFSTKAKNPDGSLIWKDADTLSKGIQIYVNEAMAQTVALLAGRKIIGMITGVSRLRALPNKTRDEINAIYSKLGAQGQVAFAAWLDSPPGRKVFTGWLWGQLYSQEGDEDKNPPIDMSTTANAAKTASGQVAWALRQVSGYLGGFVKSFYDEALRQAGGIDSQGNDTDAATKQQADAAAEIPGGAVFSRTTEK